MRRKVRAAVVGVVAACASQPVEPPRNAATGTSARLTIAPEQPLGWIGLAPRTARDPGDWIPAGVQAVIVPLPAEGFAAGAALSGIDTTGQVTRVTVGTPTKLSYGCDGNQLEVLGFTGARSAPGPVWLLPPRPPASWRPRGLPIVSPASATEVHRRDVIGPLVLELERRDAMHGTLAIVRDGHVLYMMAIERGAMAGADPDPLDFRSPGVAIPSPVAAWSVIDGGPILLVLQVPSHEGLQLTAILVQSGGAREVPAMAKYLYRCAF